MAKIAVVNDNPEVVTLVSFFVTQQDRQFLKLIGYTEHMRRSVIDFRPDVLVLPLHRTLASLNRPLGAYEEDVQGVRVLTLLSDTPELAHVPLILLGFHTTEADMPEAFRRQHRYDHFLSFPEGLQELNPIISGYIGPAGGSPDDIRRVRGS